MQFFHGRPREEEGMTCANVVIDKIDRRIEFSRHYNNSPFQTINPDKALTRSPSIF